MNMSLLAALAVIASAVEFHTPDGAAGRADDLGGGVWRVRIADAEGRFAERGAVQALAAFMGEEVPSFGAPDGSRVEVSQKPFAIRFYSRSGRMVREITSLGFACGGQGAARPTKETEGFVVKGSLPAGEGVYGFGERLDRLNQRGQKILLCSSDGWNKSDTTYAPIPFFVTTSGAGVFVNDYGTITADMGAAKADEWSVAGCGQRIDLYVWATDWMLDAVKGVHRLQGGSLTPPEWSAGPVVCRYAPDLSVLDGYTSRKYTRQGYWEGKSLFGVGVKEMLARYEAMGAKPKAFIMEGWSIEMFGDSDVARKRREALKACGEFLRSKDVKMLVYMRVGSPIDRKCPGFKDEFLVHADIFKDGNLDRSDSDRIPDVYLTGININPDSGKVAGGHVALDITNPEMWDWYVNVVWKQLVDLGVSGVKIDFCEELPDDGRDYGAVRVNYKWHDKGVFNGAAVHHAYPAFFVSRFTREMARMAEKRGGFMVFTRGGGIGSGRNPYMWAGDQTRSWNKLDDQVLAVLNSGMSGIPFMSYDYGGYQYDGGSRVEPAGVMNLKTGAFDFTRTDAKPGEETVYVRRGKTLSAEDEERIFSRALAFTSFMPCMQSHGYVRNVYDFGEATRRQYVKAVAEREELAPYIRKAVLAAAGQGVPVVSPLVLKWQDDPNTYSIADEFMLGDEILVAPALGSGETREVYLPRGEWKERATGKTHRVGREGLRLAVPVPAGGIPVFRMVNKEAGFSVVDRIAASHKILKQDVWYGYSRTTFDFDGHKAWIVEPKGEWKEGHPWTWTMQWAEAYVERTGVLDLLAEGWRHVTIDTFRHRMDAEGLRVSRAFQKYLVEELGFAPKAKLVGMSWGGFFSVRYAESFPECVDRIYLDAPLLTLGGGFGVSEGAPSGAAAEIGPWAAMPPKDGDWLADPRMPVNMAAAIAKAGIPIFLLYGGQDQTVKPSFNCEPFVERFKAAGGDITVRRRFAYGHHPHGEEHGRTCRIAEFLKASAAQ